MSGVSLTTCLFHRGLNIQYDYLEDTDRAALSWAKSKND